jgi:hypothetical protein
MTDLYWRIFDHASPRKRVEEKCNDMALQILKHIIKLKLYTPFEQANYFSGKAADKLIRHWENEILNFMDYADTPLKGGKFSYNWFFEPLTPYNEPQIEKWVDNVIRSEDDLVPNDVLVSKLMSILYGFRDGLIKKHKETGRILSNNEILSILHALLKS